MLTPRPGIRTLLVVGAGVWAALGPGGCTPDPLLPPPPGPAHAWHLVNPRPFDINITDVWGVAPERMFAAGLYGALLVRDVSGWRRAPAFTASHIHDLHGCDLEHVWAVAEEGLFRFDGRRWRRDGPADLNAASRVWCNGPNDVMVVTGEGFAHHWDGQAWSRSALDVWPASAPGDWLAGAPDGRYLAVGRDGRFAFWENGVWRSEIQLDLGVFHGALFAPDETGGTWLMASERWNNQTVKVLVWQTGHWVVHSGYDGGLFVGMEPSVALYRPYVLTSPWGSERVEIRGGVGPARTISGITTAALAAFRARTGQWPADALVVGGPFGTLLAGVSDADELTPLTASIPFSARGCTVWPGGDFAAFDRNSILHGRGGVLRRESLPVSDRLTAVWGPGPGSLWAVGTMGLIALVRDEEAPLLHPRPPGEHYFAVWGSGPDDVWVGGTVTVHWDGAAWTTVPWPLRGNVLWIRGRGPDEVYAASDLDLARWDGASWVNIGLDDAVGYFALDVAPDTGDIYTVARPSGSLNRQLMRRRDGAWEDCGLPGDNAGALVALPEDVVYVSTFGRLRRWERGAWSDVPYPFAAPDAHPWSALGGHAAGGLYAGFNTGGFYHLDLEGCGLWR